jgi:hypothetical protein
MEGSPEQTATQLIAELTGQLRQNEDAETAIDVYRTANWIISQLDSVKHEALRLAEHDMEQRGLDTLRTPSGSAGWTEPKASQLNEEAWTRAMMRNPHLREIEQQYKAARETLEQAQEPFKELPDPWFYIR